MNASTFKSQIFALGAAYLFFGSYLILMSLRQSQAHIYPVFDEVEYLYKTRAIQRNGGILVNIKSYFSGKNRDDYHHPLTFYLLSRVIGPEKTPLDFPKAKLFSLAQALALLALIMTLGWRRWGTGVAIVAGGLTASSSATIHLSHFILVDLLFVIFYVTSLFLLTDVRGMNSSQSRWRWCIAGFTIGLAYLTKGNGYLLLLPAFVCAFHVFGKKFLLRPHLYLACGAFLATSFFLLFRNVRVWGNPFHHVNNQILWLDSWEQLFFLKDSALWNEIGPTWFFKHHSVLDMLQRFVHGAKKMALLLIESLSFLQREDGWRLLPGWLVFGSALYGIFLSSKEGRKTEVLGWGVMVLCLFATFSLFVEQTIRYAYPLTVSFILFAAIGLDRLSSSFLTRVKVRIQPKYVPFAFAGLTAALILLNVQTFSKNPLSFWLVPDSWRDTAGWIHENVGERKVASDIWSPYSDWFCGECTNRTEALPLSISGNVLKTLFQEKKIQYVLLDSLVFQNDSFQDKYGRVDAFGPTSFLGWPRCFHDKKAPSHFLIYSPACDSKS